MALIRVYETESGRVRYVPEHWLSHPNLGKPFRKTPRQKAADRKAAPATPEKKETPAPPEKEAPNAQVAR